MTPKEKALKLIKMFNPHTEVHKIPIYHAKKCALIAVNELIENQNGMQDFLLKEIGYLIPSPTYWQEVKKELEKI